MAARALWKGSLQLGDVACGVGLYSAASASERIALNIVNRKTKNPVHRRYVDADTGKAVERDAQVKGYEIEPGRYLKVSDEELKAAVPESDKRLAVRAFVRCADIDKTYFDKPYHLMPADAASAASYRAAVSAMEDLGVSALAQAVLFRRLRNLLIRVDGGRLIATTLRYDYEVKAASEVFASLETLSIKGEMLDLARHIVKTKTKHFDPATIEDRYEEAMAELVRAKAAGKAPPRKEQPTAQLIDLMQALRDSAGGGGGSKKAASGRTAEQKQPKGGSGKASSAKKPAKRARAR